MNRVILIKKLDIRLLIAFIPIYLLNSCTAEFLKVAGVSAVIIVGCFLLWLFLVSREQRHYLENLVEIIWPLLMCLCFLALFSVIPNNTSQIQTNMNNIIFLIIIFSIFNFYIYYDQQGQEQYLLTFCFIDIVIASIYSIIRLVEHPNLSRYLTTGHVSDYTAVDVRGIVSYAVIYGIVLYLPVILYKIRNTRGYLRIFWFVFFILCLVVEYYAQFTIAIILCLVGVSIYYYVGNITSSLKLISRIVLVILLLILVFTFDKILLFMLESTFFPYEVQARIEEIYSFLYASQQSNSTDLVSRLIRYSQSFNAIFSNYLMGKVLWGHGEIGEHSEILDVIANYGVLYFSLLVVFFVNGLKAYLSKLPKRERLIYWVSICIFLIISFVNTSMWSATMISLFGIVPSLLLHGKDKQNLGVAEGGSCENSIN